MPAPRKGFTAAAPRPRCQPINRRRAAPRFRARPHPGGAWHDDQEKAEAQPFKHLVQAIKDNLADVKVFLAGQAESDAYIVGRADSGWAGLKTKVVQT
jgi:hypothetical protein